MRIALVAQEYPPETAKGGIGTQTYLKAHGLAALGHEVHVVSRLPPTALPVRTECWSDGVHVTRIPGFEPRMGLYTEIADWVTYSASVAEEVAALHARSPLDLVDFPEWASESYVHLLNRTEWNHVATVVQLHGPLVMFAHAMGWPEIDSDFYRSGMMMERTCVQLADAVFSSSACSADWCATHYGVRRERISVLHAGVDTELFAPRAGPKAERPTIVFAGKLVPNKGVIELVEAACRLAREIPDLRVHLLGRVTPGMAQRLARCAEVAGVPALLDFGGFVHRAELPAHFSRAHVFAMPSHYEPGPGLVYLEAMSCGLPVVACASGGAAEAVHHGTTGLLVPPNDVDALTSALRRLLTDERERAAMGAAARRQVLAESDSRECVKRLESFYLGIANPEHDVAREADASLPARSER